MAWSLGRSLRYLLLYNGCPCEKEEETGRASTLRGILDDDDDDDDDDGGGGGGRDFSERDSSGWNNRRGWESLRF